MHLLLFAILLSTVLPIRHDAHRVDVVLREARAMVVPVQVDAPAAEVASEPPLTTSNLLESVSPPPCQPDAPKTGLPPTTLCIYEQASATRP
jgi:hypothetical protein